MEAYNEQAIELFNLYLDMLTFGYYGLAQKYLRQLYAMHFTVRNYNHRMYSLHAFNARYPLDTEIMPGKEYS